MERLYESLRPLIAGAAEGAAEQLLASRTVERLSVCVAIKDVSLMCPFYPAEADSPLGPLGPAAGRSDARDAGGDDWRPARAGALGAGDGALVVVPVMHAVLCTMERAQVFIRTRNLINTIAGRPAGGGDDEGVHNPGGDSGATHARLTGRAVAKMCDFECSLVPSASPEMLAGAWWGRFNHATRNLLRLGRLQVRAWRYAFPYMRASVRLVRVRMRRRAWRYAFPYARVRATCACPNAAAGMTICIPECGGGLQAFGRLTSETRAGSGDSGFARGEPGGAAAAAPVRLCVNVTADAPDVSVDATAVRYGSALRTTWLYAGYVYASSLAREAPANTSPRGSVGREPAARGPPPPALPLSASAPARRRGGGGGAPPKAAPPPPPPPRRRPDRSFSGGGRLGDVPEDTSGAAPGSPQERRGARGPESHAVADERGGSSSEENDGGGGGGPRTIEVDVKVLIAAGEVRLCEADGDATNEAPPATAGGSGVSGGGRGRRSDPPPPPPPPRPRDGGASGGPLFTLPLPSIGVQALLAIGGGGGTRGAETSSSDEALGAARDASPPLVHVRVAWADVLASPLVLVFVRQIAGELGRATRLADEYADRVRGGSSGGGGGALGTVSALAGPAGAPAAAAAPTEAAAAAAVAAAVPAFIVIATLAPWRCRVTAKPLLADVDAVLALKEPATVVVSMGRVRGGDMHLEDRPLDVTCVSLVLPPLSLEVRSGNSLDGPPLVSPLTRAGSMVGGRHRRIPSLGGPIDDAPVAVTQVSSGPLRLSVAVVVGLLDEGRALHVVEVDAGPLRARLDLKPLKRLLQFRHAWATQLAAAGEVFESVWATPVAAHAPPPQPAVDPRSRAHPGQAAPGSGGRHRGPADRRAARAEASVEDSWSSPPAPRGGNRSRVARPPPAWSSYGDGGRGDNEYNGRGDNEYSEYGGYGDDDDGSGGGGGGSPRGGGGAGGVSSSGLFLHVRLASASAAVRLDPANKTLVTASVEDAVLHVFNLGDSTTERRGRNPTYSAALARACVEAEGAVVGTAEVLKAAVQGVMYYTRVEEGGHGAWLGKPFTQWWAAQASSAAVHFTNSSSNIRLVSIGGTRLGCKLEEEISSAPDGSPLLLINARVHADALNAAVVPDVFTLVDVAGAVSARYHTRCRLCVCACDAPPPRRPAGERVRGRRGRLRTRVGH